MGVADPACSHSLGLLVLLQARKGGSLGEGTPTHRRGGCWTRKGVRSDSRITHPDNHSTRGGSHGRCRSWDERSARGEECCSRGRQGTWTDISICAEYDRPACRADRCLTSELCSFYGFHAFSDGRVGRFLKRVLEHFNRLPEILLPAWLLVGVCNFKLEDAGRTARIQL